MNFRDVTKAINSGNLKDMIEVMKHHKEFPMALSGDNADGEPVIVSINKTNISIKTCQHNGWMRTNIYHSDGTTEELYNR